MRRAPLKYCRDCRFIQMHGTDYQMATCGHPQVQNDKVDLVSGELLQPAPFPCSYARGHSSLCGISGRHFVKRD